MYSSQLSMSVSYGLLMFNIGVGRGGGLQIFCLGLSALACIVGCLCVLLGVGHLTFHFDIQSGFQTAGGLFPSHNMDSERMFYIDTQKLFTLSSSRLSMSVSYIWAANV